LIDARNAYREAELELSRLDSAKDSLQNAVDILTGENVVLRPLVDEAIEYARNLKAEADFLDSMIADTRQSAEAALKASKAYQDIIDAINKALNASLQAIEVADQAVELSFGNTDDARKSRIRSETLRDEANAVVVQIERDLRLRLINAKHTVEELSRTNVQIRNSLQEIVLGVDMLPEDGFGEQAREAASKAMEAQRLAESSENKVNVIVTKLPEDQRRVDEMSQFIEETNRNVQQAQVKVDEVVRLVPTALGLLDRLTGLAENIKVLGADLRANITALREQIFVARDQANLIKVGITFTQDATLQIRNTDNLIAAGSYSKVSIFFRTSQRNGFLFYTGPETGTPVDYMALEVINGKAVFKFDLGSGVGTVTSTNDVNNDIWHEAIVERTGKKGKLTLRTTIDDKQDVIVSTTTGESPGDDSVLQLTAATKFFVGGVPDPAAGFLRSILTSTRLMGCIENIEVDGVKAGLWNFVQAERVRGCYERTNLPAVPENGYMFGGNGYVILAKERFRPQSTSLVQLKFKTFAENGLLFLIGLKDKDFLSLEMIDGHVVYQYDLGSGRAKLQSPQRYNDGKWHVLVANRLAQDGILKVDQVTVDSGRSSGNLRDLDIDNNIYIGGFKGNHTFSGVVQQGFIGCIKDVHLGSTERNIHDNLEGKDILPGCTDFTRIVSFTRDVINSYIALESFNINSSFEVTMKMKTVDKDGLLLYVTGDAQNQQNAFSISIVGGKIVVIWTIDGGRTALESKLGTYSDGVWHYISVEKINRDLTLSVDDGDIVKGRLDTGKRVSMTSKLYLGGVPAVYTIVIENVGTKTHFVGCIGDVSINSMSINFANADPASQIGAVLNSCGIPDPTQSTPKVEFKFTTRSPIDSGNQESSRDTCVLPLEPPLLDDREMSVGVQFGLKSDSRYEYNNLPGWSSSRSEFSVDFKTTTSNGVIFYVAGDKHTDFTSLYLNNGRVTLAFNCGSGTARAITTRSYNDGSWHKATFVRSNNEGQLIIDNDSEIVQATAAGRTQTVEILKPFFIGGLSFDAASGATANVEGAGGFVGCLRNMKHSRTDLDSPSASIDTQPCTTAVEQGSFFYSMGGHVVLSKNFSVPLDLDITLQVRPRTLSGVLLSVFNSDHGGEYLVLQMVDGDVIFSMDNGRGDVSTTYVPLAKNELCNGAWHTIIAKKAKNVVTLEVDRITSEPGVGEAGYSTTDTSDPLHIGGVPEIHRGIRTNVQYVGCIRNLQLGTTTWDLSRGEIVGKVSQSQCPAN